MTGWKKYSGRARHIELAEDTTGKGQHHKSGGHENRVTLAIPLSDQSVRRRDTLMSISNLTNKKELSS